jgi:hypothetical protein
MLCLCFQLLSAASAGFSDELLELLGEGANIDCKNVMVRYLD